MALQIEKVLANRFEFSLDGGTVVSTIYPRLFTDGNKCDFKTSTGANIIKKQNIDVTEITVIDTFGGSGTFASFTNAIQLWSKLTELDFFGDSSGGGVTTFAALSDTSTYFGNDGKVPIVNEAENKLDYTTFYNFNQLTQLSDVEIGTLIDGKVLGVTLVGGVPKVTMINKPADGTTYFSAVGGFDYNDLATQTTPLAYVSGDLQLSNDTLGTYTFLSQPPYGITGVWDEVTNTLDFSQLSVGDEVFIRIDINHTTTANNQKTNLYILFGEGTATETKQKICPEIANKDIGTDEIVFTYNFQIRNNEWRTTPAKIIYSSDDSSSIVVNGWHPYIIRKSINILEIDDSPLSVPESFMADGIDTTFTLTYAPHNVDVHNGRIWQLLGSDYLLNGADIEMQYIPDNGDIITVRPHGLSNAPMVFTATEGQTQFSLTIALNNADVYINRVKQLKNIDYQINGFILTLQNQSADAGDIITVRPF